MTTVGTQKKIYSPSDETFIGKLLPERDYAGVPNSNKYQQTGAVHSSTSSSMQASSSNLSEAFCSSVLGVPCTIQDFSVNKDYSFESALCAIKGESLIIPGETTRGTRSHQRDISKREQTSSRSTPRKERQQNLPGSSSRNQRQQYSPREGHTRSDKKEQGLPSHTRSDKKEQGLPSHTRSDKKEQGLPSHTRSDKKEQGVPFHTRSDNKEQGLPSRGKAGQTSAHCNCKTIPNKDCRTQTCPNSILKKITTVIKSPCYLSETTLDEMDGLSDKTVETAENYPVRDSSTGNPKTSDKMQQTFCNGIDKPSMDEASEIPQFSQVNYCSCHCEEAAHTQCTYGCCKCSPTGHRMEEYVNVRNMDYGCSSRRGYPGYVEKIPNYPPDISSEYSGYSHQRPPSFPKRYSMEYPPESGYPQYKGSYSSEYSYHERPKTKQKAGACCGDCSCCIRKKKGSKPPPIPQYRSMKYETSSSSEQEEDDDYDSYYNEQNDLPYQHGEDYMDLVQELEETLQSRNRNRVRRAMQEFERRSRYNKPLEKPIIDYDQTSESEEPIIQKISQLTSEKQRCCAGEMCTCRREARARLNQDKRHQPKQRAKSKPQAGCRSPQLSQSEGGGQTHWQMDMISGEWYKVSGNKHQKFKGRRRSRTPSPHKACPHDCSCCASKKYDYR